MCDPPREARPSLARERGGSAVFQKPDAEARETSSWGRARGKRSPSSRRRPRGALSAAAASPSASAPSSHGQSGDPLHLLANAVDLEEDEVCEAESAELQRRLERRRAAVAEEVAWIEQSRRFRAELASACVEASRARAAERARARAGSANEQKGGAPESDPDPASGTVLPSEAWRAFLRRNEARWRERLERESAAEIERRRAQRAIEARLARLEAIAAKQLSKNAELATQRPPPTNTLGSLS